MPTFQQPLKVWNSLVVSINQKMSKEIPSRYTEAQMNREGANFLYLTLAQLASSSVRVHNDDKDSDKEED